jgi:hypothetical protein
MGCRSKTSATPTATGPNSPGAATPPGPRRRRGADARSGAERADHREGPSGKPTPTAPGAGEPRRGHEPPDAEWLASLPVRAALKDPALFDRDALLWREMQRLGALLPPGLRPTEAEREKARTLMLAVAEGQFALVVAYLLGVPSPEHWTLCSRCRGSGTFGTPDATCRVCEASGYEIPLT